MNSERMYSTYFNNEKVGYLSENLRNKNTFFHAKKFGFKLENNRRHL